MIAVNKGYVCIIPRVKSNISNIDKHILSSRNWYLVKYYRGSCAVQLGKVIFPKEYIGKRVRFKVEIIDEE